MRRAAARLIRHPLGASIIPKILALSSSVEVFSSLRRAAARLTPRPSRVSTILNNQLLNELGISASTLERLANSKNLTLQKFIKG